MAVFLTAGALLTAFSLIEIVRRGLSDHSLPPENTIALWTMTGTLAAATAVTVFAAGMLLRAGTKTRRNTAIWLCFLGLAFQLGMAVWPTISSADNYSNALMARAWVVYGRNPYGVSPGDFPSDALYPLTAALWRETPVIYGPIWMWFSSLAIRIASDPALEALLLKILNALAYFAGGLLLYRLWRKDDADSTAALWFWSACPAALLEVANAGHNEGLLLLFLCITAAGLAKKRPDLALPGITAAILTKYWPLILIPSLAALRGAKREQWRLGACLSVLQLVFLWPFRSAPTLFSPLAGHLSLDKLYNFSPGYALFRLFLGADHGWMPRMIFTVLILGAAGWLTVELLRRRRISAAGGALIMMLSCPYS